MLREGGRVKRRCPNDNLRLENQAQELKLINSGSYEMIQPQLCSLSGAVVVQVTIGILEVSKRGYLTGFVLNSAMSTNHALVC